MFNMKLYIQGEKGRGTGAEEDGRVESGGKEETRGEGKGGERAGREGEAAPVCGAVLVRLRCRGSLWAFTCGGRTPTVRGGQLHQHVAYLPRGIFTNFSLIAFFSD